MIMQSRTVADICRRQGVCLGVAKCFDDAPPSQNELTVTSKNKKLIVGGRAINPPYPPPPPPGGAASDMVMGYCGWF